MIKFVKIPYKSTFQNPNFLPQPGVNPAKLWFLHFFSFLLLSLSVWRMGKYCLYIQMPKLSSKKQKIFILRRKKFGRIDSGSRQKNSSFEVYYVQFTFLVPLKRTILCIRFCCLYYFCWINCSFTLKLGQ